MLPPVEMDLDRICDPYRLSDCKLHIADLRPIEQEALRQAIVSCLVRHDVRWTYEAIHVEGFHQQYLQAVERLRHAQAARRSRIRVSGNIDVPSLHDELFDGLFGKIRYLRHTCSPAEPAASAD